MSEGGGMSVNCLTAGGQTVATDVKGNITTLPVNLRPAGSTTAMNLNWDSDNKLRSADIDANGTADVNFQYDALGRRVARSGTGGSVVFVQMDQQTIADYPVGGAATTPTFRYVYASYIDEPVVRKTAGTGGTLVYFHRNHQYSVTAVTTSAGTIAERYAYTAYGQPTILGASASVLSSSAINNRYTFTGREWDATLALHHFRARWMSGLSGRFVTRDPIGFDGGSLNIQEYCHSKPFIYTDPTGMQLLANPLPPVLPPSTVVPIAPIAGTVCRFAATRVCTPVAVGVTSYQCGKFVSYYTLTPICVYVTEWICEATHCQPCPTPPAPVTDTTHDHGDCLTKTGSVTHWHYFVYHQDPKTCVCYGPYRRFGGCGVAP